MNSELMSTSCDLKNARMTESQLKLENHQLSMKRIDLETGMAELKSEIHQLNNQLR